MGSTESSLPYQLKEQEVKLLTGDTNACQYLTHHMTTMALVSMLQDWLHHLSSLYV